MSATIERKNKSGKGGAATAASAWTPTPIQLQSWSVLLNQHHRDCNSNLIAIAPTGSGKTLAYGMGILASAYISSSSASPPKGICAVCLVPTRELVCQVQKDLKVPAKALASSSDTTSISSRIQIECIYGGQDRDNQIQALKRANSCSMVVVATPGRLVDLLEERSDLQKLCNKVPILVLDEADILAKNVDSCEQIESIRRFLPANVRTCLFSATKARSVSQKWDEWVGKPRVVVKVDTQTLSASKRTSQQMPGEDAAVESSDKPTAKKRRLAAGSPVDIARIPPHVTQTVRMCSSAAEKTTELMSTILTIRQSQPKRNPGLTIVFFARIKSLQSVLKFLDRKNGVPGCSEYHGQMSQQKRERALVDFRSGKSTVLLATDIAARGIHVKNLEFVINYDFPESLDQYVHRCGRAGRTQKDGTHGKGAVFSFLTKEIDPAMARSVVDLLESTKSLVDPKLSALAVSVTRAV